MRHFRGGSRELAWHDFDARIVSTMDAGPNELWGLLRVRGCVGGNRARGESPRLLEI